MSRQNVGMLAAVCALMGALSGIAQEETRGEWQEQKDTFIYQGGELKCELMPDGKFKTIEAGALPLFRDVVLHGTYQAGEEKHDSRFFQDADPASPMTIRQDGENTFTIRKKGVLKNEKYKDGGATYVETVTFSPNKLEFTYEVEQLVALSSSSRVFMTLFYLPVATYATRGSMMTPADGTPKTLVVPETYEKDRSLHVASSIDIKFSLQTGVLELKGGENTSLSIMDCRSWNAKSENFRIDIQEAVPWKSKAETFPAGKKFKWSFVITFTPHGS